MYTSSVYMWHIPMVNATAYTHLMYKRWYIHCVDGHIYTEGVYAAHFQWWMSPLIYLLYISSDIYIV